MNVYKRLLSIALLLIFAISCKEDSFTDTAFVSTAADPGKLSVLYDITQDNTGLVTLVPAGEGVSSYDVYFGDGTTTPVVVGPGKSTQHKYAEGTYTVKIVAHNFAGKTAETTQPLTVSYRVPENLKVTLATNGLAVNVTASALYETLFKVYYGDSLEVTPAPVYSFLEGQTATHTYPRAGSYTVKVVALSGGVASTAFTGTVKVAKQLTLPVAFDNLDYDYTMSDFGGNSAAVAADPTNSANKVLKVIKNNGSEVWAGTTIGTASGFAAAIPVKATASKMSVRIYSPAAGLIIKLKLEDHADGTHAVETDAKTTVAHQWETLVFDFNSPAAGTPGLNSSYVYDKASLFFNFGVSGTAEVYYADDLMFIP